MKTYYSYTLLKLARLPTNLLLLLLFSFSWSCSRNVTKYPHSGKVISIIDGDTYDLLTKDKETIRIRMEGIDAPEKGMPFYRVSKKYLSKLCFKKNVKIEITGKDASGRYLAFTYLDDGTELSHEMIKSGLAWHFKKYNSDPILSNLEVEARKLNLGIWTNENPMPPWENRQLHYNGVSTKDKFDIKEGQN
jgi:micrococcal nuclease